jgi:hypothetical protein
MIIGKAGDDGVQKAEVPRALPGRAAACRQPGRRPRRWPGATSPARLATSNSTSVGYGDTHSLTSEALTTARGSTVTTTDGWDRKGNLASKSGPGEYSGCLFDVDNRRIEVRCGATLGTACMMVSHGRDRDGQRIRKTPPSGSTLCLIDPTTELLQDKAFKLWPVTARWWLNAGGVQTG